MALNYSKCREKKIVANNKRRSNVKNHATTFVIKIKSFLIYILCVLFNSFSSLIFKEKSIQSCVESERN